MAPRLLAHTSTWSSWGLHPAPIVTILLLATGIAFVFIDPEKLVHTVMSTHNFFVLPALALAWFVELHLATRVWLRDDDSLLFQGLFRRWVLLPSAILKFRVLAPLGGFAVVRHKDGFLLLPSNIEGDDALVRWVTEQRRKQGLIPPEGSQDGRPET